MVSSGKDNVIVICIFRRTIYKRGNRGDARSRNGFIKREDYVSRLRNTIIDI